MTNVGSSITLDTTGLSPGQRYRLTCSGLVEDFPTGTAYLDFVVCGVSWFRGLWPILISWYGGGGVFFSFVLSTLLYCSPTELMLGFFFLFCFFQFYPQKRLAWALFFCYQTLCVVSKQSWFGVFFSHKFSSFSPPPQVARPVSPGKLNVQPAKGPAVMEVFYLEVGTGLSSAIPPSPRLLTQASPARLLTQSSPPRFFTQLALPLLLPYGQLPALPLLRRPAPCLRWRSPPWYDSGYRIDCFFFLFLFSFANVILRTSHPLQTMPHTTLPDTFVRKLPRLLTSGNGRPHIKNITSLFHFDLIYLWGSRGGTWINMWGRHESICEEVGGVHESIFFKSALCLTI